MLFDVHLHLSESVPQFPYPEHAEDCCIISRSARDNSRCLEFAQMAGTACAVFLGPDPMQRKEALQWIKQRRAVAYDHGVEASGRFSKSDLEPVLETSCEVGLPVILHLSRHGKDLLPKREALRCLDYVTQHFPLLKVVVAHLGGENCFETLRFAERNPNITLEMSCLRETSRRLDISDPADVLKIVAGRVSAKQIVFGSDALWPAVYDCSDELACARQVFGADDLQAVLLANAEALLAGIKQMGSTNQRAFQ